MHALREKNYLSSAAVPQAKTAWALEDLEWHAHRTSSGLNGHTKASSKWLSISGSRVVIRNK